MKYLVVFSLFFLFTSCDNKQKQSKPHEEQKEKKISKTPVKVSDSTPKQNTSVESNQPVKIKETEYSNIKQLSYAEISNSDSVIVSNTIIINEKCALDIFPSSKWIKTEQERMEEDDWMTVVDDNIYYIDLARQVLLKNKISHENLSRKKRYVKFMKEDEIVSIIDLEKMDNAWGIILYNGHDTPFLWSGTEIEEDIKVVYNQ
ncbi:hypothetical protein [Flammeovirga sp. EKP202]|uniref:hypothetical protein n=1 Tax=Flammeovirga sp. EKP202 TaxID=2770592 RepID=UPI00165FE690|nr:hypothetical protein [Flammeovirga sp. EKP202]MBD0403034.1 hypothetical protein [Flammeovirga sp. EKP202]